MQSSPLADLSGSAPQASSYDTGWLLSTHALSKDAKGFEEEWNQNPPDQRRKLRIYPPDRLIERLISARVLVDVGTLPIDKDQFHLGNEALLLLTQRGEFWALPVVDPSSGIQSAALLFDARSGRKINETTLLEWLNQTNMSLSLPWIVEPASQSNTYQKLKTELESVVGVPVADHWTDYRPARPEDFVGRETLQTSVFNFLDGVRLRTSPTRLIALKSPSGWGKSSSLLKITSRAANKRNKGKYFIFPVDSRAATTRRFPELALITGIKEATKSGFIDFSGPLEFGGASSPFSTPAMQAVNNSLQRDEKVVCVFFDQFEELLFKADLVDVFDEMRRLCSAVEEAQPNVVIGFSWKTDGVIPTEHNAYHMWHGLSDRRSELELNPFTEKEVALAINRFAKELGQPIIPQLRRVLQDHCQGFPWLLKKLCVHMLELSRSGIDQIDILNRSINIHTLFKKDLENLSSTETGCIKQIASESPAEFFKIAQNFGDETVSRLLDKRLVIRSGTRLTLYWDIFRDYILSEKIPFIPVTYVPQANFSRYVKALVYMNEKRELSYNELATQMNLSEGATDNLVRDLVNLGHVEANRKEHRVIPLYDSEIRAIEIAFSFWRSHEVVRRLSSSKPSDAVFMEAEFIELYRAANKRVELDDKTVHAYALRTLRWLVGIGLVQEVKGGLALTDAQRSQLQTLDAVRTRQQKHSDFFLGEAPPEKVVMAAKALMASPLQRQAIEKAYGRNTCYALMKLGLMRSDGTSLINLRTDAAALIAERARQTSTVTIVSDLLRRHPEIAGVEVGRILAQRFNLNWSEGSHLRSGNALRQWAEWCQSPIQLDLSEVETK